MQTIALSEAALALFRLHIQERRTVDVEKNRETYRELARAGLMVVGNSFARGEESVYHVTKTGFERKAELLAVSGWPFMSFGMPSSRMRLRT
jgi:hypothetical protein